MSVRRNPGTTRVSAHPRDCAPAEGSCPTPARIVSLCTGAFVLTAAGLLDGRPAATHWLHAERLARVHTAVKVDPKVLYIDDSDVLTSAGATAAIDLCLHILRLDHGAAVANDQLVALEDAQQPDRGRLGAAGGRYRRVGSRRVRTWGSELT
ncbi:hypothetical protein F9278_45650 [Streptomyces phaeolivaceus]|uniref:DJ-1/PfpI domain-containing protein n=1 Tax=Streptomyces phaeolivaceus TaxID=2653200 RepID=A0A5P8KHZ9_9ACTN|nr:hypothetical protein F9278_45650 [Streptomyces phaeolivaceus]